MNFIGTGITAITKMNDNDSGGFALICFIGGAIGAFISLIRLIGTGDWGFILWVGGSFFVMGLPLMFGGLKDPSVKLSKWNNLWGTLGIVAFIIYMTLVVSGLALGIHYFVDYFCEGPSRPHPDAPLDWR